MAKMAWLKLLLAVKGSYQNTSNPRNRITTVRLTKVESIANGRAIGDLLQRARPRRTQHIGKHDRVSTVDVEATAPGETWVGAAPAAANPPGSRAAVENVLVHARVVGGLETGPQVVCAGLLESGDHHGAGEGGELATCWSIVAKEVPCCRVGGLEVKEESEDWEGE